MKQETLDMYNRKLDIHNQVVKLCAKLCIEVPSRSQTVGVLGEVYAFNWFRKNGHHVSWPKKSDGNCDLLVDGARIEIKTAVRNKVGKYSLIWTKNFFNGSPCFDRMIAVILKDIYAKPLFIEIPVSETLGKTGKSLFIE